MRKKYPEQRANSIPDMKSNFSILEFYSINHREII